MHIRGFTSYARGDGRLAKELHGLIGERLRTHREVDSVDQWWMDDLIVVGDDWEAEIAGRMESSNLALLFLSSTFFDRAYIKHVELPALLSHPTTLVAPVGLVAFDLEATDMLGVESRQIFRLPKGPSAHLRFYDELRTMTDRRAFATELVAQLVRGLQRRAGDAG